MHSFLSFIFLMLFAPSVSLAADNSQTNSVQIERKAQRFVGSLGKDAIAFISDKKLSDIQKERKFRVLLEKNFDLKTIARFSLGRYYRVASKSQRKEYYSLFKNMVVNVYSERFKTYENEELVVTGARFDGRKDTIVKSYIAPKSGPQVEVEWRVRQKNGKLKVIDVIVADVSMSVTHRSEFSSIIQRGGGNVDSLIAHLKTL